MNYIFIVNRLIYRDHIIDTLQKTSCDCEQYKYKQSVSITVNSVVNKRLMMCNCFAKILCERIQTVLCDKRTPKKHYKKHVILQGEIYCLITHKKLSKLKIFPMELFRLLKEFI